MNEEEEDTFHPMRESLNFEISDDSNINPKKIKKKKILIFLFLFLLCLICLIGILLLIYFSYFFQESKPLVENKKDYIKEKENKKENEEENENEIEKEKRKEVEIENEEKKKESEKEDELKDEIENEDQKKEIEREKEKEKEVKEEIEEEIEEEKWDWSPKGDKVKTNWGINLDIDNVWQEYPRPQLQRKDWLNLNGPWSYKIGEKNEDIPEKIDNKILVPFCLESSLSGVKSFLYENQTLFYEKIFKIPKQWKNKNILLHFGAVDWRCTLYINNVKVGEHEGGYSSFYFDITQNLNQNGKNKIVLKVLDPTNKGYQPVGKQTLNPHRYWYQPVSGIWQTVWIEPVSTYFIEKLEINNDYDNKNIKIIFKINSDKKFPINITLKYNNIEIEKLEGKSNQEIIIQLQDKDFHPWSPTVPNLYIINAELYSETGDILDSIQSYTAIRKIESRKDSNGYPRIYLNNKPIFNMGLLDQGYWPDGIYTPPSEEALIFDIKKIKSLGFNTIRKHIKVEPFRYYYECDKNGLLIWQDMPSGNIGGNQCDMSKIGGGTDVQRTVESKNNYYKEWGEIIDNLKFFQSIIVWVTFNECWGQFDTEKVVDFTKKKDPSRLINAAAGGNLRNCGNILAMHHYPNPEQFINVKTLINVVGAYGGLGLETQKSENDYNRLKTKDELTNKYREYIDYIIGLIKTGISGAIYTKFSDVENELNGMMTYDRKEMKIYEEKIKLANEKIIKSLT